MLIPSSSEHEGSAPSQSEEPFCEKIGVKDNNIIKDRIFFMLKGACCIC